MINAKEKVNLALIEYQQQGPDARNAGYNIMRYTEMGYINVDCPNAGQAFVDWYPLPAAYVILDLAQAGKLSFNELQEGIKV